MTREEAVEVLKERYLTCVGIGLDNHANRVNEALDMAIEVLQAQTDGDLISRQDAIDALGEEPEVWTDTEEEWAYRNAWVEHISAIKSLPSAEPKTGEWRMLERDENVYDLYGIKTWGVNYMCDNCGFITTAIQDHFSQYKFCPSCGADMRKGGEKE